jgi:hypothetical protein
MPPSIIDRTGACGDFTDDRRPTTDEVDRFAEWIGAGAPRGDRGPREPVAGLTGAKTIALLRYRPSPDEHGDDHRCFLVDAGIDAATFLTGYAVPPGGRNLLHHAMVFALARPEDVQEAQALERAAKGPGWPCFGSPGPGGAQLVAVWTPGMPAVHLPAGAGFALPARPLVVQLHANVTPQDASEVEAVLELTLADHVAAVARFVPFALTGFVLPPGEPAVVLTKEGTVLFGSRAVALGVLPHLHLTGRSQRLERVQPDSACLANVPAWNYHLQELGWYREPRPLSSTTQLKITCTWDTTTRTQPTLFGETSRDEMCMAFLLVADPDG